MRLAGKRLVGTRWVIRRFSTETSLVDLSEGPQPWVSHARRTEATAKRDHARISPRKLQEILRPIRGLAVDEALIQLKLHRKKGARFAHHAIKSAKSAAVHNFNMDPSRLVVSHLNATKARYIKKVKYHARGKVGVLHQAFSHLRCRVKEVPPEAGEFRLGPHGRTHANIAQQPPILRSKTPQVLQAHVIARMAEEKKAVERRQARLTSTP